MIEWMVASSVLIVILVVLRQMLKGKISLRLQYALWGLVLVRLLIPFSIGSSWFSVSNWLPEQMVNEEWDASYEVNVLRGPMAALVSGTAGGAGPIETVFDAQKAESMSLGKGIEKENIEAVQGMKTELNLLELWKAIWLLGGLLTGGVLLTANVIFAMKLKKSRQSYKAEDTTLPVYLTEAVETPCLFGLFRPAIYLTPTSMEQKVALRHILAHETTHYRHKDHIWAILRGVCLVIHWYNPFVWVAAVLSRTDAELACDEATIKQLGEQERAEYGRTLISMTCQKRAALLVTATTMTSSKKGIKERVVLIARKPKMAVYTLVAVILLAVGAVGCTFTGNMEPVTGGNDIIPTEAATAAPTVASAPTLTSNITPTPIPTVTPTITPVVVFDIQAELDAVEATYAEIQQKLQTDLYLSQADMNMLAADGCTLWEEAMDTFWNVLEPLLTSEEVGILHTEQQEWLAMRDTEVQKIIDEYEGGSITGLLVGQEKGKLTRERVYELARYLAEQANQILEVPWQDYSGHYVNTQGTEEIYDELTLELLSDGSYRAEIGIYRLTTLEGTAVVYGNMLWFEDTTIGVKGNVQFFGDVVVFTVTESFFEYITPGEGFEFYKSE